MKETLVEDIWSRYSAGQSWFMVGDMNYFDSRCAQLLSHGNHGVLVNHNLVMGVEPSLCGREEAPVHP
jgi:hypothetical protein